MMSDDPVILSVAKDLSLRILRFFAVSAAQNDVAIHHSSFIIHHSKKGVITIRKPILATVAWLLAITGAHFALNVNWSVLMNDRLPESKRKLNVAYIPVT